MDPSTTARNCNREESLRTKRFESFRNSFLEKHTNPMKFSHTLSLNSNPDWADHYIDYAGLKKVINSVSTQYQSHLNALPHDEQPSISSYEDRPAYLEGQENFMSRLTQDVHNVRAFYFQKLAELHKELSHLKPILEKSASALDLAAMMDSEESPLLDARKMKSVSKVEDSKNDLEDIRRDICHLFTQYHNLQTYASLNCKAVTKILKKYDKSMGTSFKETAIDSFKSRLPFWDGTPDIDAAIDILKQYFAHFFCDDDTEEALKRMKYMIREMVSFQRRSVWLDVIQDQRKTEGATMVSASQQLQPSITDVKRTGRDRLNTFLSLASSSRAQVGFIGLVLFLALMFGIETFPGDPVKQNTLALFVFVSLLWAGEVFPLFVTSMLIPFFSVTLRLIVIDGERLGANAASKHVFGAMFSHVIMLLLGGFSIAAALSKHDIARIMAASIAQRCGNGNRVVLLMNMFVATIASMWISNVAAPVLCYSLVSPILKAATAETSRAAYGTQQQQAVEEDRRLCRALVMGIALASNVGGMASPISSPQNLFAIEYTPIGWIEWFTVSIPLCVTLNILIWIWLVICFDIPSGYSSCVERALKRNRSVKDETFSLTQYFVIVVSVGVVLLWCASVSLEEVTGQMGVLGILPFVLFFGTHILTKEDLNNFLWSVVVLAMGGLVLGETVESSGFLEVVSQAIAEFIETNHLSIWATMGIFTLLILVCTTFVSHTVGAIVVLPILQSIGEQMGPTSHAKELVFAGALACSAAMGLPVSGFPNMTAVGQEDHLGNRFLTTADFLRIALPASLLSWMVITTVGYNLIRIAVVIS